MDGTAGAFTNTPQTPVSSTNALQISTSHENPWHLKFDASQFNSIYTDNGKVYPASIALNFIIKT